MIVAKVYQLSGSDLESSMPLAAMVLSTHVNDDLKVNQLGANQLEDETCRNPVNENRVTVSLVKGSIM